MKTFKFIHNSIIMLIVCGLLNACWGITEKKIDQETKDYCIFDEGSYWIYQDSVTNNIDSVVLIHSLHEYIEKSRPETHLIVETYTNEYQHILADTSIILFRCFDGLHENPFFPVIAFNYDNTNQYGILDVPVHRWHDYFIAKYWIGENMFSDVIVSVNIYNATNFLSYWAKNIGLIQYEIYNDGNKILNTYLIKYNVSQSNNE